MLEKVIFKRKWYTRDWYTKEWYVTERIMLRTVVYWRKLYAGESYI